MTYRSKQYAHQSLLVNLVSRLPRVCFVAIFLFTSSSSSPSSSPAQPYQMTVAKPISVVRMVPARAPMAFGVHPLGRISQCEDKRVPNAKRSECDLRGSGEARGGGQHAP